MNIGQRMRLLNCIQGFAHYLSQNDAQSKLDGATRKSSPRRVGIMCAKHILRCDVTAPSKSL